MNVNSANQLLASRIIFFFNTVLLGWGGGTERGCLLADRTQRFKHSFETRISQSEHLHIGHFKYE